MGRPKGIKRPPGSGRKPGTPNRKTQDLMERCEELGLDVWGAMVDLAKSDETMVKMSMLKELAQYLFPKRKALEVSGNTDIRLIERVKELEALPDDELKKLAGK